MRLINTRTLKLHQFHGKPPPYAILSHTWGHEEVSFQDFQSPELREKLAGFSKISATRKKAYSHGLDYAWVDTCCIDKTSSAELGEAINSMFKWYRDSAIAYAFLEDYPSSKIENAAVNTTSVGFGHSRWFTRGWTLQELIAPQRLEFYNKSWENVGENKSIAKELEEITGVDAFVLNGGPLQQVSVGGRLSWAANRETTREEDLAYCLFGLFDVNMPLIYGEGGKAFLRLQEHILQQSDDHTIFAWQAATASTDRDMGYGLFAQSPRDFHNFAKGSWRRGLPEYNTPSEFERLFRVWGSNVPQDPITVSNKGIRITSLVKDIRHPWASGDLVILLLNRCNIGFSTTVGIYLKRLGSGQYARVRANELARVYSESNTTLTSIYGIKSTSDIAGLYFEEPWTTTARVVEEYHEEEKSQNESESVRKRYQNAFCLRRNLLQDSRLFYGSQLRQILIKDSHNIWRAFHFDVKDHDGDLVIKTYPNFYALFLFESPNYETSVFLILLTRINNGNYEYDVGVKSLDGDDTIEWHQSLSTVEEFVQTKIKFQARQTTPGIKLLLNPGQSPSERPLADYCKPGAGPDIIPLAFFSSYPSTDWFGNVDSCNLTTSTTQSSECKAVEKDIKYCQSQGKKIMLSIGGGGGSVQFDNMTSIQDLANQLWGMFGPVQANYTGPRPFGTAVLDGFDMDIENPDSAFSYAFFVQEMNQLFETDHSKKYYMTGAPQCIVPDANMGDMMFNGKFDLLYIQFYNTPQCSARGAISGYNPKDGSLQYFSYDAFQEFITVSFSQSKGAKLYIGLPASPDAADNDENYFLTPDEAAKLINEYRYHPGFGGIMLWDAGSSDQAVTNGCTYSQEIQSILKTGKVCPKKY
ncbi:heterokaryon incompatibility protein [Trichoderma harzianum]|uniref:Heterokaryon incompatibility protein n=1 Tax=Trichoderma harzianum TaxID=5544 RepID=A0A0F9XGZ8_TRIHA|nr:heterokaryon incompatibility protein [Trichoderma harzianum]